MTTTTTRPSSITVESTLNVIRVYDRLAQERDDLNRRLLVATDEMLVGIVEAVDAGVADKSGRKLAAAAAESGMTLHTNGGKAPSDKWFDRMHAVGYFLVAASPAIDGEAALALTTGLGHGKDKVTPAALRQTVDEAVTDGKDVVDAVRRLFAVRGEDTPDEGEGDEGEGTDEGDEGKGKTDADLVVAIGNILKGWKGDGTASVDDLLGLLAPLAVPA